MLETTAEALARHIPSEEERSAILREIWGETCGLPLHAGVTPTE